MADNNNSGRVNEPRQNGDRTPHLGGGLGRAYFPAGPAQHPGLPVQLFPDIDRPHLNISVSWRSASPQEMESEVTDPIEQEMQGVQGAEKHR